MKNISGLWYLQRVGENSGIVTIGIRYLNYNLREIQVLLLGTILWLRTHEQREGGLTVKRTYIVLWQFFYCSTAYSEGGRVNFSIFSAYVIKVWPLVLFSFRQERDWGNKMWDCRVWTSEAAKVATGAACRRPSFLHAAPAPNPSFFQVISFL